MAKKATTRKTPGRKRTAKGQTFIPGTEPPRIKEIDDKANEYRKLRDKRMKLGMEEGELKTELLDLMHKHELKSYSVLDSNIDVMLEPGEETVKVRKRKGADSDDSDEASAE